jgi:hypothetical protein
MQCIAVIVYIDRLYWALDNHALFRRHLFSDYLIIPTLGNFYLFIFFFKFPLQAPCVQIFFLLEDFCYKINFSPYLALSRAGAVSGREPLTASLCCRVLIKASGLKEPSPRRGPSSERADEFPAESP